MESMFFYPKLTQELFENSGFLCGDYIFDYIIENASFNLRISGNNPIKLNDPLETWKVETCGLHIIRNIKIENPERLYGQKGIACSNAKIGACIIWTNRYLNQMGYILPIADYFENSSRILRFDFQFEPGEIKGDLVFETILYIKKHAEVILDGENALINEEGVTIGDIDTLTIDLGNDSMDFPILEVHDILKPLWWIEFEQWEDPTVDAFSKDNIRLYLNTAYGVCPKTGAIIENIEILTEIVTVAYVLLFMAIRDYPGVHERTLTNNDLGVGSICKMLFYFHSNCTVPLRFDSPDHLHRSISKNISMRFRGEQ